MRKHFVQYKSISIRMLTYSVFTFAAIAWLTLVVNVVFLLLLLLHYHMPWYLNGEVVAAELTLTERGYELSENMQQNLDERSQWAMLLEESGEVVWAYAKPEEIKDSYEMTDIARMTRWYLEGYPVSLLVWEDKILIVGTPRGAMWKYNIQFPVSWMEYVTKVWYLILLFDFVWILILAVIFTRRWSRSREQARIEWIAGISHDIRTPLAVALGYADALEGSSHLPEEERQQAAVIKHQSLVMKELIEDLNLTSELEYSMQALRKELMHPAVVLREVAASFLDDVGEDALKIEMNIDKEAEEIVLLADRKLFIRALRNLFHNSLRHSEQDGSTCIRLSLRKEKRWCLIRFSDNGIGYSGEMLRQLGSRRRKPSQNIRGLGIVSKIIWAHGGKVLFGNGEEGGSFCEMRMRICKKNTMKM